MNYPPAGSVSAVVALNRAQKFAQRVGLANRLSEFRIFLTVVAAYCFYYAALAQTPTWWPAGSKSWFVLAAITFVVAGLLDFVDGRVARWSKSVSAYGKFIDPLSDKVLNYTMLGLICYFFYPSPLEHRYWYLLLVPMAGLDLYSSVGHFRDFLTALKTGEIKESTGSVRAGQAKMWVQIFAIIPHLLLWWPSQGGAELVLFGYSVGYSFVAQLFASVCLAVAILLAIWSLWDKHQKKKAEREAESSAIPVRPSIFADASTNEGPPSNDDITPAI